VANFYLTDADLEDIRQHTNNGEKYFKEFSINITDQHNTVVAKVIKTIYIRKKVKH
jgi:hypothetical protein